MFGNITLGQYFPGNSPVHKLDPRTKILLAAAYITLIFLIKSLAGYAAAFLFICLGAALSGIRIQYLLKGLRPILYIVIFTFVINIFFTANGTKKLFTWRFITITEEGIQFAVFMALRLVFLILGTQVMLLTTSPLALTDGIESLLNPLKKLRLPVHELAMMMTIALRFIPTLLEETDKIMKAQASRGADFETGNIVRRARNMVPLLVPLFVSAFRRADELAMAMEARCYKGGHGRTRMKVLKFSLVDLWGALVMLALTGAIVLDMLYSKGPFF
jgi:energy-coupling factor transport system permease protein